MTATPYEVLHNNKAERIRLNGIDCPEKGQAYGKRAKQAASALVFGKEVTLQTYGKDKYGRTLAEVLLPDGTNVNHELVKDGWCWWYRTYAPGKSELEKLEQEAQEAKKGLWADPKPVPRWVYRKARRGQSLQLSGLASSATETEGNTVPRGPPLFGAVESNPASPSSPYPISGNCRSHVYHRPDCASQSSGNSGELPVRR